MQKTKTKTTEMLSSRDMMLGHCSKIMEGIDETIHILTEKLEDAYAIYFPEAKIKDRDQLVRFVATIDKDHFDVESAAKIIGESFARSLEEASKTSMGAKLTDEDVAMLKQLANEILSLKELKATYAKYAEKLAAEVCPNITALVGSLIAAKLVAHAGSVKKLALMPASTIQVLGAEKALFKHLRNKKRVRPPKHGILFQYAKVCGSPKAIRGKIARALAAKLATAAKADAFDKKDISGILIEQFNTRYNEILEEWKRKKQQKKKGR